MPTYRVRVLPSHCLSGTTTSLTLLSPRRSRHHNIPIIDVEAMGSGMTPAQSDYDIHHPRDFYAMASGMGFLNQTSII